MKFNFDWNYVSAGAPYVTVSELGLAFNSPSISLLNSPEDVVIGFDEAQMTIGVMDAKSIENAKTYGFRSRIRNGWVRIGCKDFVKYLEVKSGMSFSPAKKFMAKYDVDEKLLYFTVKADEVTD